MRRQVRVHPRRRAAAQDAHEQPEAAVATTRPAADTRSAQGVIDKIDEVLDRH
ncbi:MAG: hypothetical protein ACXV5Q_05275 [Frankiaceae bacterium]|jgi:hypothetical protein